MCSVYFWQAIACCWRMFYVFLFHFFLPLPHLRAFTDKMFNVFFILFWSHHSLPVLNGFWEWALRNKDISSLSRELTQAYVVDRTHWFFFFVKPTFLPSSLHPSRPPSLLSFFLPPPLLPFSSCLSSFLPPSPSLPPPLPPSLPPPPSPPLPSVILPSSHSFFSSFFYLSI